MAKQLRVLVAGTDVPDQVVCICFEIDLCAAYPRSELGGVLAFAVRYFKRIIVLGESLKPGHQVEIDKFESRGADGEQVDTFTIGDTVFEVHLRFCLYWRSPIR